MGGIASQSTSLTIVYSTVYSDAHQRKHQSSASLAFVCVGISLASGEFPAQMASNAEMFPFDDVIMRNISGLVTVGRCITIAIWRCRKLISQWHRIFHRKLCCPWLKESRHRQIALGHEYLWRKVQKVRSQDSTYLPSMVRCEPYRNE